ncbi:hypothetical protein HHI36_022026 [Cryptolaemus montrouzieri]|uniref:Uncharacterized protein n=1 Tax=Cryptolaemus montrouzieri TaxID=559131 RepID=A0ABD2MZW5_9CUCU
MSVANITSIFRSTGIYPFNTSSIPEEAFATSTLFKRIFEPDSSSDDDIPLSDVRRHIIENRKQSTNFIKPTPGPSGVQQKLLLKSRETQQENTEISTNGSEPAPGLSGVQQKLPLKSRDTQRENTVQLNLSTLQEKSFKEILKTPDLHQRKHQTRRKAINYVATYNKRFIQ